MWNPYFSDQKSLWRVWCKLLVPLLASISQGDLAIVTFAGQVGRCIPCLSVSLCCGDPFRTERSPNSLSSGEEGGKQTGMLFLTSQLKAQSSSTWTLHRPLSAQVDGPELPVSLPCNLWKAPQCYPLRMTWDCSHPRCLQERQVATCTLKLFFESYPAANPPSSKQG